MIKKITRTQFVDFAALCFAYEVHTNGLAKVVAPRCDEPAPR